MRNRSRDVRKVFFKIKPRTTLKVTEGFTL
jgi:hypothetical protein